MTEQATLENYRHIPLMPLPTNLELLNGIRIDDIGAQDGEELLGWLQRADEAAREQGGSARFTDDGHIKILTPNAGFRDLCESKPEVLNGYPFHGFADKLGVDRGAARLFLYELSEKTGARIKLTLNSEIIVTRKPDLARLADDLRAWWPNNVPRLAITTIKEWLADQGCDAPSTVLVHDVARLLCEEGFLEVEVVGEATRVCYARAED